MEIVLGFGRLAKSSPSAIAIGNFDGVHIGHQAMLNLLTAKAAAAAVLPAVLTFEPHPLAVLAPQRAPPRLYDLRAKAVLLAQYGIKRLHVIRFTQSFAAIGATDFLALLTERCAARFLAAGSDFRFGHQRLGDIGMLRQAAARGAFELLTMADCLSNGLRVSSKRVRAAVAAGEFALAATLLGRPYAIAGRVVRGDQIGRKLGLPTANLRFVHEPALRGVYAAWASIDNDQGQLPAAMNVGTRPAVGGSALVIETHLPDYSRNLYGHRLSLQPVRFMRPERNFASQGELAAAMRSDVQACLAVLKREPLGS